MPSVIQIALFLEALANVTGFISLIFYPESILRWAIASNSILPDAEINRTTTLVARCAAMLIVALTPQLLLALPDSRDCVGKRKLVYWTLGVGEAGLIALFLWEAFREGAKEEIGGFTKSASLVCAGNLVPFLAWRVFVFGWKGHWFGPQGSSGREKEKQ